MTIEGDSPHDRLRRVAEARVRVSELEVESLTAEEARRLVHDLQIHQVELEIQNEELRRTRNELETSREHFMQLFHSAPMGYIVLDEIGLILRANRTFCGMVGRDGGDIVGEPFADFMEKPDRNIFLARYKAIFENPSGKSIEARISRDHGPAFHARIKGAALSRVFSGIAEGNGHLLLLTISDITEKKNAEKALTEAHRQLDSIIEFLPDATFVIDQDGRVIAWNRAMEIMTGIAKADMLQKGNHEYAVPFYGERRPILIDLALSGEFEFGKGKYDQIQRHGDVLSGEINVPQIFAGKGAHLWGTASVLRDSAGNVVGAIETIRDISKRKRAEEERIRLEKRLQQAAKAESLRRMAGAIAHHFNNMLGAVIGNLELAMDELPDASESRQCIAQALKASNRASEISRFMLTYLGQTIGRREPLDLMEAVREARSFFHPSLNRNVHLEIKLTPPGPMISADGAHIKQILTNLLSNAVEAIGEGEGQITVAAEVVPLGEIRNSKFLPMDWKPIGTTYACLAVADSGPGLDAATLERIFDPFFTTRFTGRGMGLPVVLGLMRAYEGAVTVESKPGQGATFKLYFPMTEEGELPLKDKAPPPCGIEDEGTVLVVDDEPLVRDMVRSILERRLGYRVLTAVDGFEALAIFRAHQDEVRLVLLDLSMPGMNGWQTLTALRTLRPDIPVILTSGYDEAQVMREKQAEQPQAFLQKPFQLSDLKASLATAHHAASARCTSKG